MRDVPRGSLSCSVSHLPSQREGWRLGVRRPSLQSQGLPSKPKGCCGGGRGFWGPPCEHLLSPESEPPWEWECHLKAGVARTACGFNSAGFPRTAAFSVCVSGFCSFPFAFAGLVTAHDHQSSIAKSVDAIRARGRHLGTRKSPFRSLHPNRTFLRSCLSSLHRSVSYPGKGLLVGPGPFVPCTAHARVPLKILSTLHSIRRCEVGPGSRRRPRPHGSRFLQSHQDSSVEREGRERGTPL